MTPTSIATIAGVIGAEVLGSATGPLASEVSTDTRNLQPGSLFWGIKGGRFDGAAFAGQALAAGAVGAVTSREFRAEPPAGTLLVVEDPLAALQAFASWYRDQFCVPVAAVTGSVGKTTITSMAFAAFQGVFGDVHKTYKNFNGQVGLPLSLLRLERHHDAAVLECGISLPGEMAVLARTLRPEVACVANAGPVHLEALGTLDDVAREKLTLLDGLRAGGVAVLNHDDPRVAAAAGRHRTITFGLTTQADVHPITPILAGEDGIRFQCNLAPGRNLHIPIVGRHHAVNALAALAMVQAVNKPIQEAMNAIEHFQSEDMRMKRIELNEGVTALMDAYNASPASMAAAVQALVEVSGGRRSVAVIGEMFELGPDSGRLHEETARAIADTGVNAVFFAGAHSGEVRVGLAGFGGEMAFFPDTESLAQTLPHLIAPGDLVLFKASRGMRFENALAALQRALNP